MRGIYIGPPFMSGGGAWIEPVYHFHDSMTPSRRRTRRRELWSQEPPRGEFAEGRLVPGRL